MTSRRAFLTTLAAAFALAGCSQTSAFVEPLLLSTAGLQARLKTGDCAGPPESGYIRVLYRKYDDADKTGGCGFFRASRLEARWVLASFDAWESHAPEVVYKSSGTYPLYTQRVIRGGCPPGKLNCAD